MTRKAVMVDVGKCLAGNLDPKHWNEDGTCKCDVSKVHIGDVAVCQGEPPGGNPYGTSLCGPIRKDALRAFKNGETKGFIEQFTFWHAPCVGGAKKITREEIDWETSGV